MFHFFRPHRPTARGQSTNLRGGGNRHPLSIGTLSTHLEYTHHNRRCRKASVFIGLISAVAKEGFTAGQPHFTVRVIEPKVLLMIGVATADAPDQRPVPKY